MLYTILVYSIKADDDCKYKVNVLILYVPIYIGVSPWKICLSCALRDEYI